MASFSPFVDLLAEIEDPRRAEGKLYRLPQVVLFAILAIVAGANSYRTIHSFIDVHLAQLRDAFGVKCRKAPAYTTIRGILRQLDPASVEAVFRRHDQPLRVASSIAAVTITACSRAAAVQCGLPAPDPLAKAAARQRSNVATLVATARDTCSTEELSGGNSLATIRSLYACPYRATFVFLRPQGSDPI